MVFQQLSAAFLFYVMDTMDRVVELGADDYVPKWFAICPLQTCRWLRMDGRQQTAIDFAWSYFGTWPSTGTQHLKSSDRSTLDTGRSLQNDEREHRAPSRQR